MKFIQTILILVITIFTACKTEVAGVKNVSANDLRTEINKGSNIQILDVRTDAEWQEGVIEKAFKVDVTSDDFDKIALDKLDKNTPVYVYCRSGGRSLIASEILEKKGFKVFNVEGGYNAWKQLKQK